MASNKIVKHTSIYAFSDILGKMVGFIMLPIYTRYLTPDDYGTVELFTIAVTLLEILLGARMGQAIFKFYYDHEAISDRNTLISTSLLLGIAFSGIAAILLASNSGFASQVLLGSNEYSLLLAIFSTVVLTQSIEEIGKIYIRAQQKPMLFLWFAIGKLALQLCLNIYLVVILELHVAGVVYSAIISSSTMALISFLYVTLNTKISFSTYFAKKLLIFSYPFWLSALGGFYIGSGDRYYIRLFSGLEEVGIYALGYKFGFLVLIFAWQPFAKMWQPYRYEIYRQDNANATFQKVFLYITIALSFFALAISMLTRDAIMIMSEPSFWRAHEIVPAIAFAYVIQALTYYSNFGILISEKTKYITYATFITVGIITVLYITLIDRYGAMGAAWATLLAFIFQFFWIFHIAKKQYDMGIKLTIPVTIIFYGAALYWLSLSLPNDVLILSIFYKLIILIFFLTTLFFSPLVPKDDRAVVKEKVKTVLKMVKIIS